MRSPAAHPRSPPTYRYKQQILDAMESDDEKLAVDILFRAIQVRLWSRPTSGHAPHPLSFPHL